MAAAVCFLPPWPPFHSLEDAAVEVTDVMLQILFGDKRLIHCSSVILHVTAICESCLQCTYIYIYLIRSIW